MELNGPKIRFGTDGWRAIIADGFTFENLRIVSQAYADYLQTTYKQVSNDNDLSGNVSGLGKPIDVVVGYDCRFLSKEFATEVASVLSGNGIRVVVFEEPVPTPLVSWTVKQTGADGGIVITASHNPAEYNGFKVKTSFGGSASREITSEIESLLGKETVRLDKSVNSSLTTREVIQQSLHAYRVRIESLVDLDCIRNTPERIIIDSMYGSGGTWIQSFLRGKRLKFETIRDQPDPLFGGINPEPVDQNLGDLKSRVKETNSMFGIATDGDADRIGVVNELGDTMTMHEVVPILLLHLVRNRKMKGGIVTTFSQSVLVKRIAEKFGLPVFETPIGFKYIVDLMLTEDILIGAEESGGIGVQGHIPERDAVLNSLLFMEAVFSFGKVPTKIIKEIHDEFGKFYFRREDIHIDISRGHDFMATVNSEGIEELVGETVVEIQSLDGVKFIFDDESWLLFRQSGTESVMRVYCEASSKNKLDKILSQAIRKLVLATE